MDNIKIKALKNKGGYFLSAVTLLTGISSQAIGSETYLDSERYQNVADAKLRSKKIIKELEERRASVLLNDNFPEDAEKLKEKVKRKHERTKETQQSINRVGFRFLDKLMSWLD